jgi:hypothetical protein
MVTQFKNLPGEGALKLWLDDFKGTLSPYFPITLSLLTLSLLTLSVPIQRYCGRTVA